MYTAFVTVNPLLEKEEIPPTHFGNSLVFL